MTNFLNTVHMFYIMHFTLDRRVCVNKVLPVHCYSLVMVSFLLKLYFFFNLRCKILSEDVVLVDR